MEQHERSQILLGEKIEKLRESSVIIFGLGGVGGQLTEALARMGIGRFLLVDFDKVSISNLNRQIIATYNTIGMLKTKAMMDRILSINPSAVVETSELYITLDNIDQIDFSGYDYVADAVDTVSAKIAIIKKAKKEGVPVITSMGAGNRLSPNFVADDIHSTYNCPLAKKVRGELKKLGIKDVKAVFSPQQPIKTGQTTIGSVSFVPPAAGLVIAAEIIKDLIDTKDN